MAKSIPARLSPAEGRKFGLTVGTAFLVLAALMWWRHHEGLLYAFAALSALLIGGAVAAPARLGPVQRAWMGLAHMISKVTTPVFMGIVYFVVIMPAGILMRIFGRNPIRHRPVGGSYWAERSQLRGNMTNQF